MPAPSNYDATRDQNRVPVAMGQSNVDATQTLPFLIDPVTGRVLVDSGGSGTLSLTTIGTSGPATLVGTVLNIPVYPGSSGVSIFNDTVSGTINSSNVTFTVPNTIAAAISLYLANSIYQAGVDYTFTGTTITMTVAPDASLSGQPFFLVHT